MSSSRHLLLNQCQPADTDQHFPALANCLRGQGIFLRCVVVDQVVKWQGLWRPVMGGEDGAQLVIDLSGGGSLGYAVFGDPDGVPASPSIAHPARG